MSKASKIIADLAVLIQEHGDLECYHEDDSCHAYSISGAKYDDREEEFKIV